MGLENFLGKLEKNIMQSIRIWKAGSKSCKKVGKIYQA